MAWLEQLGRGNLPATVAVGALAVALPLTFPRIRPVLLPVVKGGAKIFLEAEWGADGDIADALVDETMDALTDVLSQSAQADRREAARAAVGTFKRRARSHARRWGRDDKDRGARYDRRVTKLRRAVSRARMRSGEPLWDEIAGFIVEE